MFDRNPIKIGKFLPEVRSSKWEYYIKIKPNYILLFLGI